MQGSQSACDRASSVSAGLLPTDAMEAEDEARDLGSSTGSDARNPYMNDPDVKESMQKVQARIHQLSKEHANALDEYYKEVKEPTDEQEKALKKQAADATAAMRALVKTQAPKFVGDFEKLRQDAIEKRREQWLDAKARQREARKKAEEARKNVIEAQYGMQEIQAKNAITKSAWVNISVVNELRDATACTPFPSCLQAKRANGTCGDTYPAVSCIRARRGEVNLCETSAKIQDNCCGICLMNNVELCKKERLILAGFGDGPTSVKPPVDTLTQFDTACGEKERKDFSDHDKSRPEPLSPAFNKLIKKEYANKYGNSTNDSSPSNSTETDTDVELVELREGEVNRAPPPSSLGSSYVLELDSN